MKKAVLIGAGQTGRGFIAPILKKNNYELVFVDKNEELIQQLRNEKSYMIEYFGNVKKPRVIDDFKAYLSTQQEAKVEMANADVIIISVFASNIKDLIPLLKDAIHIKNENHKMKIICCENGVNVKQPLIDAGIDALISEGLIFCTTLKPKEDSLRLMCEDYPELPISFVDGLDVHIEGMPVELNFHDLIQRKIYTYNFISAVVAYLGSYMGYKVYGDAANDVIISTIIDQVVPLISRIIAKKYTVPYEIQLEFTNRAVRKFKNKEIYDTIYRNSRQAERKLGKNERLLVPLKLAYEYKEDTALFKLIIAAAMFYGKSKEKMLISNILNDMNETLGDTKTSDDILRYVSLFEKGDSLQNMINDSSE